ncbi:protein bicaudal C homolog 1-like [Daphnia pulicaria]|uniref:protein bicaudal C homolog 1-like n=1 Tax=Daphnia pulicaria TaxID=35523 RepID=UPI001EECEC8D|nr:protein bicaudal C homolog 1-like [Daphnia pulicaria]
MQKITSATARFYPVKLSMEVSFTTHSHIIGRAGTNINTVMKETSTKIHFPDENRVAGEKKSNEVTISGELVNVETARRRIRFLIPIEYVVECRTEVLDSYGRSALVKDFAILYGVLLRLNEKTMGSCSHCSATIRGSQHEIGRLKEAVNHLMKLNQNLETLVSMKMEFSSDQLETLRANFNLLEAKYSTAFMTLKLTNLGEEHQVVWIRGSVDGVYQTKMALMEFLPMKLMFHVHAIHLTFGVNERKLAKRLDVAVKMEPSTKPSSFLLQIISYEKNAGNIYEFRRQILRLPNPNGLSPIGFPLSLPRVQEPERTFLPAVGSRTVVQQPRFRETTEEVYQSGGQRAHSKPLLPSNESVKMPASICTLKFDKNSYRQLCQLLKESDLFEYCELFLANEVDLAMFTTLSDDDLKSIGVTAYRPRKLMLHAISELKNLPISCAVEENSQFCQL